ncbi:class I SAM-dependent methyltransferase, partial [Gammaproteobacteria bacterium]|nr:class I SAM-dependent methyltransferase [Gammaproteobacteria bacterium]
FSGTSTLMADHFKESADKAIRNFLKVSADPFVVEIGSNDGIMLRNFAKKGIRHLGIEPSANVAQVATDQGINTIVEFFDKSLAARIVKENGHADLFMAANVMCHIPYIKSIIEGIKVLLKPDGIVMFEDPYLGDVIQNTTYDQIYDEHTFLYSVRSVDYLFRQHGMEVIRVEPLETHGGSMRYMVAHKGRRSIQDNVYDQLQFEKDIGLNELKTYQKFRQACEQSKAKLMGLLRDIRSQGKSISGYAATSKSTTIINYCGITREYLDCIYDTTPIKLGKYSPGAHIPIVDHDHFKEHYPDYALLFGYNHEKEIMTKERDFMARGGRWITYVPTVRVID